jgi:hypothetical protein
MNCYGMPAGAILAPQPYYFVTPASEPPLTFYYTVDTGDLSGSGTADFQIIEASTGKIVQDTSTSMTFPAHSTNIISWDGTIADDDGYQGVETLTFTTTIGTVSVQTSMDVWVEGQASAGKDDASADAAIRAKFMPGVLGVGSLVTGYGLPCMSCYGAPGRTILLPPPYYFVTPVREPGTVILYYTVETKDVSGSGTCTFKITQDGTGKVAESANGTTDFLPNGTNITAFYLGGIPDTDRYNGAYTLLFTAGLGNLSA